MTLFIKFSKIRGLTDKGKGRQRTEPETPTYELKIPIILIRWKLVYTPKVLRFAVDLRVSDRAKVSEHDIWLFWGLKSSWSSFFLNVTF